MPPGDARPGGRVPESLSWALGSGTLLQALNSSMIAVAVVPIADSFGTPEGIPWLVSGLYIASAVGSPAMGRLGDLFGPRRIYLAGLVVVLIASLLGPFVPTLHLLVADRVLLGLGTAAQFPTALALVRRRAVLYRESGAGALGAIALCSQVAAALGPTVGGVVVQLSGWQGVFWANVPVVLISALLVYLVVPPETAEERTRCGSAVAALRTIDAAGMVLFGVATTLLMSFLLSLGDAPRWGAGALLVPVVLLLAVVERRSSSPMLDVALLRAHPQITVTCVRTVVTYTAFYCIFYGIPQWLQADRGLDPLHAGLVMVPVFAVATAGTFVAARVIERVGPRQVLFVGSAAFVVAGALVASCLGADTPATVLVLVALVFGVPGGFNGLGNQYLISVSAPPHAVGAAGGLFRTSQYVGAALSSVVVSMTLDDGGETGVQGLGLAIGGIGVVLLGAGLLARHGGRGVPAEG